MSAFAGIKWGRIVIAAFAIELVLFAVIIPWNFVPNGATVALYLTIPACLVATFFGARWAASKATGQFVLHGLLVGILAALMYWGISSTSPTPLPIVYVIANYLKILAGAASGYVLQRAAFSRASGV
jgi:hypothetical protein